MDEVLRVESAVKRYGTATVLNGVDFTVKRSEVLVILGRSGSGKSTLLRCINGLERLDSGRVFIGGREITAPGADARLIRESIGFVFQQFNLYSHKSALENVMLSSVVLKKASRREALERATDLLEQVGMSDHKDKYPHQLSGGQQQRVAIARSLMLAPSLVLFDEPTSALDAEMVKGVLEAIKKLAFSGMTLVIVTHEIKFAREIADYVAFMEDGRVVEIAPPDDFFLRPRSIQASQFISQIA